MDAPAETPQEMDDQLESAGRQEETPGESVPLGDDEA